LPDEAGVYPLLRRVRYWRTGLAIEITLVLSYMGEAVRRVPGTCKPGHLCRSPPAHLVALPGQLVFETSSRCGPVKAAAAIGLPRGWYSSQAVA
jgi:hypothetical protein